MSTIRAIYEDGRLRLLQPMTLVEGQEVEIIVLSQGEQAVVSEGRIVVFKMVEPDKLKEILLQEMEQYASEGLNGYGFLTANDDQGVFAVVDISKQQGKRIADVSLIARLKNDRIIIELDMNHPPLYEALMQAGIPREQIILAYAGELKEEPAQGNNLLPAM